MKPKASDTEIRQQLYELRRHSQERHLEFMGIDVKALQELERDIDREFTELIEDLHAQKRQEGTERAERHVKILEISQTSLVNDIEKALDVIDGSDYPNISDYIRPCRYIYIYPPLVNSLQQDNLINIDPPSGGTGTATVTYDSNSNLNQAQPYVDVRGGGVGTLNTVHLKTWHKFAYTPSTDGLYSFRPQIFMNGWWLLWTWGNCEGTSAGNGTIQIKLRVRVDQLSTIVKEVEYPLLDQNANSGNSDEGGLDYASERYKDGFSIELGLQGGHEAVIFVECEIYAQVSNYGRAIIDMQSGSNFYFNVEKVFVGKYHCLWWREVPNIPPRRERRHDPSVSPGPPVNF